MSGTTFRRIHPGSYPQEYEVLHDGVLAGIVRYRETRYNLVRVYVTREWHAIAPDGSRFGGYLTRREATAALVENLTPRTPPP